MILAKRAGILAGSFLLSAGAHAAEPQMQKSPTAGDVQKQLSDLRAAVEALSKKVDGLQTDQFRQMFRINDLEGTPVTLKAGLLGYEIMHSPLGSFILTYVAASPYLDGFQVQVGVGNLTSATMNGVKVHLTYGPLLKTDEMGKATAGAYTEWLAAQKSKDFDLTTVLAAGRKTTLVLPVLPAKAEDVSEISVSLVFDNVGQPVAP